MSIRPLPRSTPEAQGVGSASIEALFRAASDRELQLHSLMVVRHGNVIAEGWWAPYAADRPHMMYSVSKSFTASAIGIAEADGLLSVDDEVLSFFPSYATDAIRANMKGVRIRDLLAMASGHDVDGITVMRNLPSYDWVKLFLEIPIVYPPGTHFLYNSGASFVLSAIIAARTGQNLVEYLTPRLFEPLGMAVPTWEKAPSGLDLGASGMRLTTEDLAKLGQLYLQKGLWNGQRVLSEDWVERATSVQVDNSGGDAAIDWRQGYGFQFWRSQHDSFRADGAFGQFSLVFPTRDLVVAITEGSETTQATLDAVWDLLLPGMQDASLPADPDALAALEGTVSALELPVPAFLPADSPRAATVAGRSIELSFTTLGFESVSLAFDERSISLTARHRDGWSETVPAGRAEWLAGSTRAWPQYELTEAALFSKAGWIDENTLELHQQCVDTPYRRVWRFEFAGDSTAPDAAVAVTVERRPKSVPDERLVGVVR
jgi:CubicO group peptidase (beta-lactamase class C family)